MLIIDYVCSDNRARTCVLPDEEPGALPLSYIRSWIGAGLEPASTRVKSREFYH